ncbi:MAG: 8-oxo-dGTP diphosphatase [Frankiaceae bacterium]|nr:8-oxo-dGTP diphosphatase [Frankiaceae bacterium]
MRATPVVVAAAILDGDPPALLAAQRGGPAALAGKWELPGGKVEVGETEQQALERECHEELDIVIAVGERAAPDMPTVAGDAVLRTYWARLVEGSPRALEHAALRWLTADELGDVAWLAADLPVIAQIRHRLHST